MRLRIVLRIFVGVFFTLVSFSLGYARLAAAFGAEEFDTWLFVKGFALVVLGFLNLAALVISHRARRRLAARNAQKKSDVSAEGGR